VREKKRKEIKNKTGIVREQKIRKLNENKTGN
jgi:hypothetical protein